MVHNVETRSFYCISTSKLSGFSANDAYASFFKLVIKLQKMRFYAGDIYNVCLTFSIRVPASG